MPAFAGRTRKLGCTINRAPADIAAAEAARPVDLIDRGVGACLRLADVAALRSDAENASAIGEDAGAVAPGAGMEDLHIGIARGVVETFDLRTFGVGARLAFGRHHDAERGIVVPFEREAGEPPLRHSQERRQQIGPEA